LSSESPDFFFGTSMSLQEISTFLDHERVVVWFIDNMTASRKAEIESLAASWWQRQYSALGRVSSSRTVVMSTSMQVVVANAQHTALNYHVVQCQPWSEPDIFALVQAHWPHVYRNIVPQNFIISMEPPLFNKLLLQQKRFLAGRWFVRTLSISLFSNLRVIIVSLNLML
jgi:hypothetical protein